MSTCQLHLTITFLGSYIALFTTANAPIEQWNSPTFKAMNLIVQDRVQPTSARRNGIVSPSGMDARTTSPTSSEVFLYSKDVATTASTAGRILDFKAESGFKAGAQDSLASIEAWQIQRIGLKASALHWGCSQIPIAMKSLRPLYLESGVRIWCLMPIASMCASTEPPSKMAVTEDRRYMAK